MRISQGQMVANALERHSKRMAAVENVQSKMGSGKRIERPSEGPGSMAGIFSLRSATKARIQEERNAQEATTWLNLADAKLQDANRTTQRAHELLVRAGSPLTPEERFAVSSEILGLRDELAAIANSKHQGQGLFAGFSSSDAVSKVAGTWTFTGDNGKMERRVGEGESVVVNATGDDVFGFNASADIFTILETASTSVLSGDPNAVNNSLAAVEGGSARILDGLAKLGVIGSRVERVLLRNQTEQVTLRGELSGMEDVDLAEMVMELQLQEVGYEASLAAMSRVLMPSLVDFLR